MLGDNNNNLRIKNDVNLSSVEGLIRPSTFEKGINMSLNDWKFYNHAVIPAVEPHEQPDLTCIKDKSIWKVGGIPLLARWSSDFDCGYETSWWYCIKDDVFDITRLSSSYRYKIKKGKKLFDVKKNKSGTI